MPEAPSPSPQTPASLRWIDSLTRHRKETSYGLFIAAAISAILPLWLGIKFREERLLLAFVDALLPLLCLLIGLWHMTSPELGTGLKEAETTRLTILIFGALLGVWGILNCLTLGYYWWNEYFAKGLDVWRAEWWRLALCMGSLFGGLAVMLASLNLGYIDVRTSAFMRRMLYGYNAVLSGILLLSILGLVNVLGYVQASPFNWLGIPGDWTSSGDFSVSPASRNVLRALDRPTVIYVLQTGIEPIDRDVQTLMSNMRPYTDKLEIKYIPNQKLKDEGQKLQKKYRAVEAAGLLIVYGADQPHEEYEFISFDNPALGRIDWRRGRWEEFDAENAVINKLKFLMEGKVNPKVYFTQGSGEPDMNNARPDTPGLGALRGRLTQLDYEVAKLDFSEGTDQIPDDAALVVVVRPRAFTPAAVKALTDYLEKESVRGPAGKREKGKLLVLFSVDVNERGAMRQTGLEDLMKKYNVAVGDKRVLSLPQPTRPPLSDYPLQVVVTASPRSPNRIAQEFQSAEGEPPIFRFWDVRTVQPVTEGRDPRFAVEAIFNAAGIWGGIPWGVWEESNLRPEAASAIMKDLQRPEKRTEARQKVKPFLPAAVAVTETIKQAKGTPEETPRMVVYGAASWVYNDEVNEGSQNNNFELFRQSLSWLRGSPDLGRLAEPKARKLFYIERPGGYNRLLFLPAALMLLAIIGIGGGIWVVRRR